MMSGVRKAEFVLTARLALAGVLGLAVWLLLPGAAATRPMHPYPPTWRIQPAPPRLPSKARTPKTKKRKARPSAWAAVVEPVTAGAIARDTPPLPERKPPEDASMPVAAAETGGRHAAVVRDDAKPEPQPEMPMNAVMVTGEVDEQKPPRTAPPKDGAPAELYCRNIGDAAAEARYARQKQELQKTEKEVAKRVEELNAKIAEYRRWIARRDAFSRKADAAVVNIYAKMKPDAAAQQLAILDEELAAALLMKLNPRVSSAVMNEMESKRAARLAAIIAMSTKGPGNKPPAKPETRTQ